jgi:RimJ/RimL family protein N-acetyltransferase
MRAPVIRDDQHPDPVQLRPHTEDDVGEILALGADPEMQRWTTVPVPYLPEHADQFVAGRAAGWEAGTSWGFAVESLDDGGRPRLAGNLDLRPLGSGAADVGFALAPWARGRGVMSRAVRLALSWGFEQAGLTVVQWQAHVGNWDSRRVAWACGFRIEGTVRGLCEQRGQRYDGWIGSIVRGDDLAPVTPWLTVPDLRGEGVVLRPWRPDDVPRVAEACADPQTRRWLAGLPSPYTVADAQEFVRTREDLHATGAGLSWCVADPDDDRCLGSISVFNLNGPHPTPEIGYWAHPDARGRGAITAAVRLVVRHTVIDVADGGLGQPAVILHAAAGNAASNRVAVRAGMSPVGPIRNIDRARDGSVSDLMLYDILAEECPPPSAPPPLQSAPQPLHSAPLAEPGVERPL